jgi:lambda repressor-like predicted transcriptional regulator
MLLNNDTIAGLPHVEGALHYLARMTERPYNLAYDPAPGEPRSNIVPDTYVLPIYDMRPATDSATLDREGFALLRHRSAITDYDDADELRRVYYPEAERIVADAIGAERVVIFDHTIRRRQWGAQDRAPGTPRQPVTRIHGDYTEQSGPQRVRDLMDDEAEALLRRRFAIVNVWRPIRGPLRDAPLAVCHAGTVASEDLVVQDLIYRNRRGETYGLTYNPAHRWFYVPEMRTDEVLLLKCYDSLKDGRARFMPHTSFQDPTAPADVLPRESIELRTLAFFPA